METQVNHKLKCIWQNKFWQIIMAIFRCYEVKLWWIHSEPPSHSSFPQQSSLNTKFLTFIIILLRLYKAFLPSHSLRGLYKEVRLMEQTFKIQQP